MDNPMLSVDSTSPSSRPNRLLQLVRGKDQADQKLGPKPAAPRPPPLPPQPPSPPATNEREHKTWFEARGRSGLFIIVTQALLIVYSVALFLFATPAFIDGIAGYQDLAANTCGVTPWTTSAVGVCVLIILGRGIHNMFLYTCCSHRHAHQLNRRSKRGRSRFCIIRGWRWLGAWAMKPDAPYHTWWLFRSEVGEAFFQVLAFIEYSERGHGPISLGVLATVIFLNLLVSSLLLCASKQPYRRVVLASGADCVCDLFYSIYPVAYALMEYFDCQLISKFAERNHHEVSMIATASQSFMGAHTAWELLLKLITRVHPIWLVQSRLRRILELRILRNAQGYSSNSKENAVLMVQRERTPSRGQLHSLSATEDHEHHHERQSDREAAGGLRTFPSSGGLRAISKLRTITKDQLKAITQKSFRKTPIKETAQKPLWGSAVAVMICVGLVFYGIVIIRLIIMANDPQCAAGAVHDICVVRAYPVLTAWGSRPSARAPTKAGAEEVMDADADDTSDTEAAARGRCYCRTLAARCPLEVPRDKDTGKPLFNFSMAAQQEFDAGPHSGPYMSTCGSAPRFTPDAVRALADVNPDYVQHVIMYNCKVGDAGLRRIVPAYTRLEVLYLLDGNISTVPAEIGEMSSLQALMLNHNPGIGPTMPNELQKLQQLFFFEAINTTLAEIPRIDGSKDKLHEAYLSNNRLSSVPSWFATLTSMRELKLVGNNITDLDLTHQPHIRWAMLGFNPRLTNLGADRLGSLKISELSSSGESLRYLDVRGIPDLQTLDLEVVLPASRLLIAPEAARRLNILPNTKGGMAPPRQQTDAAAGNSGAAPLPPLSPGTIKVEVYDPPSNISWENITLQMWSSDIDNYRWGSRAKCDGCCVEFDFTIASNGRGPARTTEGSASRPLAECTLWEYFLHDDGTDYR